MDHPEQGFAFAKAYVDGLQTCLTALDLERVAQLIDFLEEAYRREARVFILGNGGSAATASHLACDLGRTIPLQAPAPDASPFRAVALADNIALFSALANDVGYEHVFSEQLRNMARPGDLVLIISGSGDSPNVVNGALAAREIGASVVGLLGFDGGKVKELADACLVVPSKDYGHIEDVHLALSHLIAAFFRRDAFARRRSRARSL